MENRVKLSKDGTSIDFTASDNLPTSLKKFRQSPEIEGFYRFIFENDLQKEALEILERIIQERKAKKQLAAKAEKGEKVATTPKLKATEKSAASAKAVKTDRPEHKQTATTAAKPNGSAAKGVAKPAAKMKVAAKPTVKAPLAKPKTPVKPKKK